MPDSLSVLTRLMVRVAFQLGDILYTVLLYTDVYMYIGHSLDAVFCIVILDIIALFLLMLLWCLTLRLCLFSDVQRRFYT